ncbi:HNH endonuclease signature motif containing protein [[Mycobacterium] holstebronense]|uniref:HNH endonuclease signature motif containing protein n=1 Tax=[Mycobacterium] holstebronense TaxID=3064288 RepID=A0ABM9M4L1_9MYCO|nr:HNH endonuclease signature motif containing protein [Mycolicibacter sp. MU0102]CAJ1510083.1 HNH endonuclease signature motif containing protein [Mycolicibacter sp. MU0102]
MSRLPTPGSLTEFRAWFLQRHPRTTPESAALVDRVCASARAENRAAAAQLVAIGELFALRLSACGETEQWAVDTEAAVAAEVAAALRISQGLAGSRLHYARAMREQLPQVAEVFKAGDIDMRLFQTMVYRTGLITDPEVLAVVDGQLAAQVTRWPSLTMNRLAAQIDKIVAKADADAVRRRKERQAEREIVFGNFVEGGLSEIQGSLFTTDARAVDKALDALAATVCEHDPRTREQRRADAMGALAARADRLGCRCGRRDCVAGGRAAASPVVIYVIAEQATVDGTGDAPGSLVGSDGLIPPELIAELARSARLVSLVHPGDAPPEPGYVPSKALADFVRCRDMTCRWPGCDRPALDCDLDHTIAYGDGGFTHASNLKCYCRTHHLVKTFWGWRDQQLPDGTVILTSPSGQTYVSTPGSSLLFPHLCAPTGELPTPLRRDNDRCGERTAMMPRRRRTRAQNRAARIATERNQNHKARQARRAAFDTVWFPKVAPGIDPDDPPPF